MWSWNSAFPGSFRFISTPVHQWISSDIFLRFNTLDIRSSRNSIFLYAEVLLWRSSVDYLVERRIVIETKIIITLKCSEANILVQQLFANSTIRCNGVGGADWKKHLILFRCCSLRYSFALFSYFSTKISIDHPISTQCSMVISS